MGLASLSAGKCGLMQADIGKQTPDQQVWREEKNLLMKCALNMLQDNASPLSFVMILW